MHFAAAPSQHGSIFCLICDPFSSFSLQVFTVECSVVIFPVFPVFLGKSRADTKNAGKLKIDVVRGCSEADAERAPFGMPN